MSQSIRTMNWREKVELSKLHLRLFSLQKPWIDIFAGTSPSSLQQHRVGQQTHRMWQQQYWGQHWHQHIPISRRRMRPPRTMRSTVSQSVGETERERGSLCTWAQKITKYLFTTGEIFGWRGSKQEEISATQATEHWHLRSTMSLTSLSGSPEVSPGASTVQ